MKNALLDRFQERPVLRHLKRLTTKDGLVQHADYEVPDPAHGYSIDDNARALIVCLWYNQAFADASVLRLAEIYFQYLERTEKEGGSFHNFLSFAEKVLDSEGSDDSIGRAVWALGEVIAANPSAEFVEKATTMLERVKLDRHLEHNHIRTKAYIFLGLSQAGQLPAAERWINRLVEQYNNNATVDWPWFEPSLRYANGILPYALARASRLFQRADLEKLAITTFDWLDQVSREGGVPAPIGQDGWYVKGQQKAIYDQQPLEAADMILAAAELYQLTNSPKYLQIAIEWYGWYEGNNTLKATVINSDTGGIYDGLTPGGVNKNQGAESIVTYLLAVLALNQLTRVDG